MARRGAGAADVRVRPRAPLRRGRASRHRDRRRRRGAGRRTGRGHDQLRGHGALEREERHDRDRRRALGHAHASRLDRGQSRQCRRRRRGRRRGGNERHAGARRPVRPPRRPHDRRRPGLPRSAALPTCSVDAGRAAAGGLGARGRPCAGAARRRSGQLDGCRAGSGGRSCAGAGTGCGSSAGGGSGCGRARGVAGGCRFRADGRAARALACVHDHEPSAGHGRRAAGSLGPSRALTGASPERGRGAARSDPPPLVPPTSQPAPAAGACSAPGGGRSQGELASRAPTRRGAARAPRGADRARAPRCARGRPSGRCGSRSYDQEPVLHHARSEH